MEVTKQNFKELRPEIEEAIRSCTFMAIDGEFTGLNNGDTVLPFDEPSEYYGKLLSGSLDFLFVQFGLSLFTHISGTKYDNKTYIFFLFPEPMNRDAPDCRFLCQSSSLSFLAKHGFNFNKLFRDGIPYLKQADEAALRDVLEERKKQKEAALASPGLHIDVPSNQKPLVDQAMKQIKELLEPDTTKTEVRIEKCSGFVRKLVYQTLREELPDSDISVETVNGILVAKKKVDDEQMKNEKEEEIQSAIGFVNIIRSIINSSKLIVGHNMLLDICHVVRHFVDHLPSNYIEFKEMVHSLFPKILDTKFFCSCPALKDLFSSTCLPRVLETVSQPPFELPEIVYNEDRGFPLDSERYHDSGYDAFVTGVCFLSSLMYLESKENKSHDVNSPLLSKIINRLFLMRTPDLHLHLGGKDPQPKRNHVFHVTFPKSWTATHLSELFSPFGSVQISWCSDTSAWVALHDLHSVEKAKKLLSGKSPKLPNVVVMTYGKYRALKSSIVTSSMPGQKRAVGWDKGAKTATDNGSAIPHKKRKPSPPRNSKAKISGNEVKDSDRTTEISQLETVANIPTSTSFPISEEWD